MKGGRHHGRAAHLVRAPEPAPRTPRPRPAAAQAPAYPPGFFTELMLKHDFPPRWRSAWPLGPQRFDTSATSTANRMAGKAFGGTTLPLKGAIPWVERFRQMQAANARARTHKGD